MLAQNMIESDKEEVWLANGLDPKEALAVSLLSSQEAFCWLFEGEPIGMWGLQEDGCIWFLCAHRLTTIPIAFHRKAKAYFKYFRSKKDYLYNYTRNPGWLYRNGFTIEEPAPYGWMGASFYKFWWRK